MKDQDKKHTDKFGYASVQVGDMAALFSNHFEEYGGHYGTAAQSIGDSLGLNGSAYEALQTGQRFFQLATGALPVVGACALATTAATTFQAVASVQHADRLAQAVEGQLDTRRADHLLNVATRPEALNAVLDTAILYGKEANASQIHLVVADSYHAAQLSILLQRRTSKSDTNITVFETLQEAIEAASSKEINNSNNKVLIYFHTLEPVTVPQDLRIANCTDFILRSDTGQAGLQPRLALTGTIHVLSGSRGGVQNIALCGDVKCDKDSQVIFIKCTNTIKGATGFSMNHNPRRNKGGPLQLGSLLVLAPVVAVLASALLFSSHRPASCSRI